MGCGVVGGSFSSLFCLQFVDLFVNGCIFGKMCILSEKGNRKWMYNTISLTDTFMVSINKNDVHKMVDRQKKRV